MEYTTTVNRLDVVGRIWMPNAVCAMTYDLDSHDVETIRDYSDGVITRDAVQSWVDSHCGDFAEIIDFAADFGNREFECTWTDETNEITFVDCMYGTEE